MRRHDIAVLALTAAATSTDAISYLGLNEVFPANMTGNTVPPAIGITSELAAIGSAFAWWGISGAGASRSRIEVHSAHQS